MPIPLSFIPPKRKSKYPTTVQLCPKFPLGIPLFNQTKRNWKMKVVIYSTCLLDAEPHRCTIEIVKHM